MADTVSVAAGTGTGIGDMPTITDFGHAHTVYNPSNMSSGVHYASGMFSGMASGTGTGMVNQSLPWSLGAPSFQPLILGPGVYPQQQNQNMSTRRLIQVFICDPDENVPLESSLLYSGDQKLTDLTDQELFFEIPIKDLLSAHNEKRITFVDKKIKERTQHLEPARVRDLKMVVTTVAQF